MPRNPCLFQNLLLKYLSLVFLQYRNLVSLNLVRLNLAKCRTSNKFLLNSLRPKSSNTRTYSVILMPHLLNKLRRDQHQTGITIPMLEEKISLMIHHHFKHLQKNLHLISLVTVKNTSSLRQDSLSSAPLYWTA
jgi:hypothetical protein